MNRENLQELGAALYRYCLSLTRSAFEADDLAQETWAKALAYRKFTASPNPEALLLRIARNTWIDHIRRTAALTRAVERSGTGAASAATEAVQGDLTEIELIFQALLAYLTPLQRTALVLRDVLGYSAAEAAGLLDTTEGAVKAALHRARLALVTVREELVTQEGPALPQDADYRAYLHALAQAYEQGQIPVMLELLRQEIAQTTACAISTFTVQAVYSGNMFMSNSNGSSAYAEMRMAA
ncbi:RNA polymerase sigma factor [Paenibacillus sp. FSL K6-1096]|uniref:RNA polymerase sigma factor n=1 Tax=Paenibacillus sp. FSL K6-1096 TaxID=2921460 RepID=UPI0030EC1B55